MERSAVVLLSVLALFTLACGLLNEDDADVSYTEDIPIEYTVDADQLCPPSENCDGQSAPAPQDIELMPIEQDVDVDVVEATGNQELTKYSGSFKSIEIVAIDYEVSGNNLTFDLPQTDLYIGPMDATSKDDEGVTKLATIPTVSAGENASGTANVDSAGRAASSEQLKQLQLSSVVAATPVVKEGQEFPPSGTADVKYTIKIKFTANPLDN